MWLLSRSWKIPLFLITHLWIRTDGCCRRKCKHWLCAAVHTLWNGYLNHWTRTTKLGRLHWNCDKVPMSLWFVDNNKFLIQLNLNVWSSHLWGFLADTCGRRRVLLVSMGGSFTCALLSAFSFNVITLIITRLFVGILWVYFIWFPLIFNAFIHVKKKKKLIKEKGKKMKSKSDFIAVFQVFKRPLIHISENFTAMKHEQKLYPLWQCLCQLVLFSCHYWHGQSFQWNGNGIYLIAWAFHRGAFICCWAVFWMESILSVCINCQKVQNFYFLLIAKMTLWMCWKECIQSIWM